MSKLLIQVFIVLSIVHATLSTGQSQEKLPANIKRGFVASSDNVKIHYMEAKPQARRHKASLLFVPGWMTPGWIWEHQIAYFSRNYRVVAIDPRGQGQSSKPTDGNYPTARGRDIKAVVDQLRLGPVVIVAATSAVTEVVSYVGEFGTDKLAGLVLVNGIAGRDYDKQTYSDLVNYAHSFQENRVEAANRFVKGLYKTPQPQDYMARMVKATLRMPTSSAMALILSGLATDNRPALSKINKPTLIVVANVRPWMQFYEDLQTRIRGSKLHVFEDGGHALFVDQPDRFNNLVQDFLNQLHFPY